MEGMYKVCDVKLTYNTKSKEFGKGCYQGFQQCLFSY